MPRPFVLLAALVLLAGCGSDAPAPAEPPAAEPQAAAHSDIQLKPVTAEELLADLRTVGSDLVVVNYWATWCAPCREEFPDLVRFAEDADPDEVQVRFVSVDFEDEAPAVLEFLGEYGVTGPAYIKSEQSDGPFINALNPQWSGSIPASFIYDRDGNRLDFWEGKVTYAELAERIEAARARS